MVEGKYYFFDDLEYQKDSWQYCTLGDRRFYLEINKGLRPDGRTIYYQNETSLRNNATDTGGGKAYLCIWKLSIFLTETLIGHLNESHLNHASNRRVN